MAPGPAQITAWKHCYTILQQQLALLVKKHPASNSWTIIFEYELPRERGRRPDVILLAEKAILVLEFKDFTSVHQAHIDQVAAYARDLQYYHAASHQNVISPLLVLTQSTQPCLQKDDIWVVPPSQIPEVLLSLASTSTEGETIQSEAWLSADYAPLPTLVTAARIIFNHEPLPHIRRAQSAGIPETIAELVSIGKQAQQQGERHLALVTGVPGAGKTLVGLQFVYQTDLDTIEGEHTAVFLSGNGPLVKVLQHALKSRVFVQDVHGFLKQYGGNQQRLPQEHVWVYDEAQRAWDAARVQEKRGHGASEPEDFLRLGERMPSWALVVGLIGEGQEIHLGEEAGLGQWNDALKVMRQPWIVHCPQKVASLFPDAFQVQAHESLDLTTSLRSHLAEDVQLWVRQILDGQFNHANKTSRIITEQGFDIYITQNVEAAKRYVQERYDGQVDKRYGLLASSKAKNLAQYGIQNGYEYTKNFREGPWYNDPPTSAQSCCQLKEVATEFACQGLELDFPIIGWGNDLLWQGAAWKSVPQPRSQAHNPHQLRLNSYRVLLSRGRDGLIVFVPPQPQMEPTYKMLLQAGLLPLS